jgi:undecaprenyl phosphate-alpha-L-ara4FN deformylase
MIRLGLRVDVDTLRGTLLGVPALCELLKRHRVTATFFFSAGPDNMGRHVWRLLRPAFLAKMLRSRAASLYGWDVLMCGVFWPGPVIGKRAAHAIRTAAEHGHEIGLHAWDHHEWQANIDTMPGDRIGAGLDSAAAMIEEACGARPCCSAAPSWRCTDAALLAKAERRFRFNSDCRGRSVFWPSVNGRRLEQPQIPCTLPTYDEVIGANGITDLNYNAYMLSCVATDRLNVLTIHAEVEGIAKLGMFGTFLEGATRRGIAAVPLRECMGDMRATPVCPVVRGAAEGREGWVSLQGEESNL